MTAVERWNRIVDYFNKHINAPEQTVQVVWESIFTELLGYSRLEGEIDGHRKVRIGSTERVITDIIIKDGDTDLFVVELKQHNMQHNSGMELQLLSYLKQLRNNTGILICNKIYIFDYNINKGDDEQDRAEIEFIHDNLDGIKFIELFSKGVFDVANVKRFIQSKIESIRNIEQIKNEITADLITDMLRNHYVGKYSSDEYEQAVKDLHITIAHKRSVSPVINKSNSPEMTLAFQSVTTSPNKVQYEFVLNGVACDGKVFEEYLINYNPCSVKVLLIYHDRQENRIWQVRNFTASTNLKGNLASGFLRDWKRKGIIGIKLEV